MVDNPAEHDPARHWEQVASDWTAWAREPGHDAYWYYRDAFRQFLPPPGVATLEIGCGEGRIARDLTALGHHVTATDISPSLIAAAEAAESARRYAAADATSLPLREPRPMLLDGQDPAVARWERLPLFLWINAVRWK
jgi:2-polyprenyl-3-methyl-5-hydroxy-6-metoxy-1,4-benzoquinol methylase